MARSRKVSMRLYKHEAGTYILFINGDAWELKDRKNDFVYACREHTLMNPTRWFSPAVEIQIAEAPKNVQDSIDTIKQKEYY